MTRILFATGPLLIGFLLDLILGDPPVLYHPVRAMGKLIAAGEGYLRRRTSGSPGAEHKAGVLLVACCVVLTGLAYWLLGYVTISIGGVRLFFAVETWICYRMLAAGELRRSAKRVERALEQDDIARAREAVSAIVGRDTASLDEAGVARAAVETVAENTSDGVIAPMLWLAVGGMPLGAAYKMVNTLDSMVGYQNERYQHFGWASARLDDFANWLPARISALLMTVAAFLCGLDGASAFRIWRRDRLAHQSPNSAQTESVCAGALGIRLGGASRYGGIVSDKPYIGDEIRPIETADIRRTNRIMTVTSVLALPICLGLRLLIRSMIL